MASSVPSSTPKSICVDSSSCVPAKGKDSAVLLAAPPGVSVGCCALGPKRGDHIVPVWGGGGGGCVGRRV